MKIENSFRLTNDVTAKSGDVLLFAQGKVLVLANEIAVKHEGGAVEGGVKAKRRRAGRRNVPHGERQKSVLDALADGPATTQEVMKAVNPRMSKREYQIIYRTLQRLKAHNRLEHRGPDDSGQRHWVIKDEAA
jgi:hypothetical protein